MTQKTFPNAPLANGHTTLYCFSLSYKTLKSGRNNDSETAIGQQVFDDFKYSTGRLDEAPP